MKVGRKKLLQEAENKPLSQMETEVVECPFVTVPLNVLDDRLLGKISSCACCTCARRLPVPQGSDFSIFQRLCGC